MTPIPWHAEATLVRTTDAGVSDGGRAIVAEGPLHRVLLHADTLPPAELERHFVALPERRAPPFRYDAAAIQALLGRLDRPGAVSFAVPARG